MNNEQTEAVKQLRSNLEEVIREFQETSKMIVTAIDVQTRYETFQADKRKRTMLVDSSLTRVSAQTKDDVTISI
jgi:hypothetical protein